MAEDLNHAPRLSPDQIRAVQESWEIISANSEENGQVLMKRLLTDHPEAVSLFSFGKSGARGDAIFKQPAFSRHCRYVMDSLDAAVRDLGDLRSLVPVLENLGERHRSYQVKTDHFQYLQEAFIFMLKTALGDKLTKNLTVSWLTVYAIMTSVLTVKL